MTVDEIMRLADEYADTWHNPSVFSDAERESRRSALRTALKAQDARIAELGRLLQQAEVNLIDAYDMCMKEIDRASPAESLSQRINSTTAAIRCVLQQDQSFSDERILEIIKCADELYAQIVRE